MSSLFESRQETRDEPSEIPVTGTTARLDSKLPDRYTTSLAVVLLGSAMIIGLIGILGWMLDITGFRVVFPGLASMKFNTGLSIILIGGAGLIRLRPQDSWWPLLARFLSIAVLLLASLTLVQYMTGLDFAVDQLFMADQLTPADEFPGRMSIATACCFLVLAAAKLARSCGWHGWGQSFASVGFIIGFLGFTASILDPDALYSFGFFSSMALHTSFAVTLLAAGHLMMNSNHGFMAVLYNLSIGGYLARYLVPTVVLVPIAISGLTLWSASAFGFDNRFGIIMAATLSAAILMIAVYSLAYRMQQLEEKMQRLETESTLQEERLVHVRQAEVMGLLAGGLAHDFNNLLLPISWATEMGLSESDKSSPQYKRFQVIKKSVEKAHALAEKMLRLGDAPTGRREVLMVDDAVTEFRDILRGLLGGKADLELDLGAPGQSVVFVRQQFEQVLLNLVSNARRAIEPSNRNGEHSGGRVMISTRIDEITGKESDETLRNCRPGQYVRLGVTDNGSGMSDSVREKALQPFFSTRKAGLGHGLGLATVSNIAHQHNGCLQIESSEGYGTTVYMHMPIRILATVVKGPKSSGNGSIPGINQAALKSG